MEKINSHQNSNCEFAEEIIDFLYGEMKSNRLNAFNSHLNKCSDCETEVRDFSEIKFSIQDWKTAEFDKLSTPQIIIPYEKSVFTLIENEKSLTFFQSLKTYFSLSPIYSGAAAVLVAAAFLFAMSLILFSGKDKDLLAENNTTQNFIPTNTPKSAETVEQVSEPKIGESVLDEAKKDTSVDIAEDKTDKPEISKNPTVQIGGKTVSTRKMPKTKMTEMKTNAPIESKDENKTPKSAAIKRKPRLNELPEDDEDKTLRLADLFAELETR